jgi:Domain of unknown function (DUF4118)
LYRAPPELRHASLSANHGEMDTLSNPEQRRGLRPYLFAIALVAVAALLRWAASDILRATPYLAFFPACVFAAILGGFWPGMLAFLSSWLCERLLFAGGPLWI